MTQSKEPQNEKLINDLYEKLNWYTFEASNEQFDAKEVDAIVQLLDVLEPMKEDPGYPSDPAAARERFYKRYGLEAERAEQNGSAEKTGITAEDGTDRETAEGKPKKRKKKKMFVRFAAGLVACLVLMLSVNVGSYALKKKSFFEVVLEEVERTKIIVTGNEDPLEEGNETAIEFSSWKEAENYLAIELLQPEYLPKGYEVDEIALIKSGTRTVLLARYYNILSNKSIQIKIDIFKGDYSERTLVNDSNWKRLKDINDIFNSKYYISEEYKSIRAIFTKDKNMYIVLCQESVEELKKITESMK